MNDQDLRALLNRAREFEHTVGSVTFRCRIPTPERAKALFARVDAENQLGRLVEGSQAILADSVLGIRGATVRDIGLEGDDSLPDTPVGAREYLAEHIDAADDLWKELNRRTEERRVRIEGDAKN